MKIIDEEYLFCINCGKKIPHEAIYCIHCGSKVPKPEIKKEELITPETEKVNEKPEPEIKQKRAASNLLKKKAQNRILKAEDTKSVKEVNPDIVKSTVKAKESEDEVYVPPVLIDGKEDEVFEVKRRELITSKTAQRRKMIEGIDIEEYDDYYENVDPIDKGNEYNPFEKNKKTIMIACFSLLAFFAIGVGVILYVLKDF